MHHPLRAGSELIQFADPGRGCQGLICTAFADPAVTQLRNASGCDYVQAAGLVDVLDTTSSEITVFAPTDDAFAALAAVLHMTPEQLLAESDLLSVVRTHVCTTYLHAL